MCTNVIDMWLFLSLVLLLCLTHASHGTMHGDTIHQQDDNPTATNECDLCHHNFTIILGTGRSGSSSLLGMLNLLPRYDLSGEHNGQLFKFKDLYDDLLKVKYMKSYAWVHKKQELQRFLCYVQQWYSRESGLKTTWMKHDVHGFKEIVSCYCCIVCIGIYYVVYSLAGQTLHV